MQQLLKHRFKIGDPLTGCFVMLPSPAVVEMLGYAGFDYVILDAEHGASGTETLENQLRAAKGAGIPALVRTVGKTLGEILRVLDAGADGIVVPHVCSAEEAREIVRSAHYPPFGVRGLATTARAGRHGFSTVQQHLEDASARILVLPQIEDAAAIECAKEISEVEGVDGVFIGPADLSISLGFPGNPTHPVVANAIKKIASEILAAGKTPMTFVNSATDIETAKSRGIHNVVFSTTALFAAVLRDTIKLSRQIQEVVK